MHVANLPKKIKIYVKLFLVVQICHGKADLYRDDFRTKVVTMFPYFIILFCSISTFPWWLLKAPLLNPSTYIYRYYNIDPTEGSYYVQKYVRKSSKIRKEVCF